MSIPSSSLPLGSKGYFDHRKSCMLALTKKQKSSQNVGAKIKRCFIAIFQRFVECFKPNHYKEIAARKVRDLRHLVTGGKDPYLIKINSFNAIGGAELPETIKGYLEGWKKEMKEQRDALKNFCRTFKPAKTDLPLLSSLLKKVKALDKLQKEDVVSQGKLELSFLNYVAQKQQQKIDTIRTELNTNYQDRCFKEFPEKDREMAKDFYFKEIVGSFLKKLDKEKAKIAPQVECADMKVKAVDLNETEKKIPQLFLKKNIFAQNEFINAMGLWVVLTHRYDKELSASLDSKVIEKSMRELPKEAFDNFCTELRTKGNDFAFEIRKHLGEIQDWGGDVKQQILDLNASEAWKQEFLQEFELDIFEPCVAQWKGYLEGTDPSEEEVGNFVGLEMLPGTLQALQASRTEMEKEQKEKQFKEEIEAKGFKIQTVPQDGSCLFHSLSQAVQGVPGVDNAYKNLDAAQFRVKLFEYIKQHKDAFKGPLFDQLREFVEEVKQSDDGGVSLFETLPDNVVAAVLAWKEEEDVLSAELEGIKKAINLPKKKESFNKLAIQTFDTEENLRASEFFKGAFVAATAQQKKKYEELGNRYVTWWKKHQDCIEKNRGCVDAYIEGMGAADSKAYGGPVELSAAQAMLNVPIRLYNSIYEKKYEDLGDYQEGKPSEAVNLLRHKYTPHFDWLKVEKPPTSKKKAKKGSSTPPE